MYIYTQKEGDFLTKYGLTLKTYKLDAADCKAVIKDKDGNEIAAVEVLHYGQGPQYVLVEEDAARRAIRQARKKLTIMASASSQ